MDVRLKDAENASAVRFRKLLQEVRAARFVSSVGKIRFKTCFQLHDVELLMANDTSLIDIL